MCGIASPTNCQRQTFTWQRVTMITYRKQTIAWQRTVNRLSRDNGLPWQLTVNRLSRDNGLSWQRTVNRISRDNGLPWQRSVNRLSRVNGGLPLQRTVNRAEPCPIFVLRVNSEVVSCVKIACKLLKHWHVNVVSGLTVLGVGLRIKFLNFIGYNQLCPQKVYYKTQQILSEFSWASYNPSVVFLTSVLFYDVVSQGLHGTAPVTLVILCQVTVHSLYPQPRQLQVSAEFPNTNQV